MLGLLYVVVLWRYQALIPLTWLFAVIEYSGRLLLTFAKPFEIEGTAPGAIGNYILIPLAVLMLVLSLKRQGSVGYDRFVGWNKADQRGEPSMGTAWGRGGYRLSSRRRFSERADQCRFAPSHSWYTEPFPFTTPFGRPADVPVRPGRQRTGVSSVAEQGLVARRAVGLGRV